MALIKWDPFREMDNMKESWSPCVDIFETENEVVIKAELPGMESKDIDIKLSNNVLMLGGDRRFEKDTKTENYHRVERSYGTFTRSFSLPAFVDDSKVHAEYKNGLLRIVLPKKEQDRSKEIKISAA
jgi:HSP20 family protein